MKKDSKDDVSWWILKLWTSIPRSIRFAFLWFVILGISFLGWVKIIRRLFELE
ncbi:hypothetical protein V7024_10165 [Bacillus sp. JJ864]|uniref:hypothetical protein n=1 Tax=Bacillus sp. JJ864 TaxID=3122975 RepID=UPI0030006C71